MRWLGYSFLSFFDRRVVGVVVVVGGGGVGVVGVVGVVDVVGVVVVVAAVAVVVGGVGKHMVAYFVIVAVQNNTAFLLLVGCYCWY